MLVNRVTRAKQFLPFDALKGLQQALREKEIEYEEKKELSEDTLAELNNKFYQLENGKNIKLKYYKNGRYREIKGIVTNIFSLDDIQNAMEQSTKNKADIVKSVIKITQD